ncbi:pilus assembly protein [Pseudomonas sp.]|uniref:pilus assembly protein n=1 Tax=Pseudomonas sp. TaxID=306 RepID=UPI002CDA36AE|nr:PilC/PilY family type IV pilus protein [Pseudomonas sp.]HUE90563.1 PilC/PilY family type IV pilus protein [Pseudomonas sp.]
MNSHARRYKLLHTGVAFTMSLAIAFASTAQADVSQSPLLLGGGSVPGNLALVPSVEWPTIVSMANLGTYSVSNKYVGYFDSDKCYDYSHDAVNSDRRDSHFFPKSKTSNRSCAGQLWSGNFLNWAATQTIDPFRSALTGGYRVRDTPTETWLEKARHTGQNSSGARVVSVSTLVGNATPANWSTFKTRLAGLGNRMRFTLDGNLNGTVSAYTSNTDLSTSGSTVYEVYIRVKVCDSKVGLEQNCKQYSQGYKPEGLIQQYSSDIRYSVFSYLNDHDVLRDGGVLRAKQKFVGQTTRVPGEAGNQSNAANEWDATTGVFIQNPNAADASATNAAIVDSGVINYLNKFGQMTTKNHKSKDPVSELFYTALRYFKNQGNVSAYSTIAGDAATRYESADGFPVITAWDDPIQYACQKNVILGIGDTNTHRDKNLPGNLTAGDEPAVPSEVSSDKTVNVVTATQKVAALEGITISTPFTATGQHNSAYIAGLAYDAHTKDLRKDWKGEQTVSTHWVDVRENETLAGKANNQYWLAAKYGGFKVPKDFDPYTRSETLPESWWHTSSDMLGTDYPRPDNFYVASDAAKMIESLELAFAQIAKEVESTTASLAANSTRMDTDTAVFQSQLNSKRWSGDLLARLIVDDEVGVEASWSAASALDALSDVTSRKIFTSVPPTADSTKGPLRSIKGIDFTWSDLKDSQRAGFIKQGEVDTSVAQQRVAFLRGDRSLEITDADPGKPFRQRASRLGDIVNSDPQFIHQQNFGYSALAWSDGAVGKAYAAFRAADAYKKRTPMIVVGANDGMLHGFDARVSKDSAKNGGSELFAYVPNNVLASLSALAEPAYSHQYYVDATPRISDAWLGSDGGWRTVAVGATGAGGNSVFALDVTDPDNMSSDSVLWEFTHPSMGYTMGQPALVALPNQKFGVIVSSGYHDSTPANGKVWILDVADGSVIKEFTLATKGGLGTPLVSDTDLDQVADRVYVADTLGNLWRLDLSGNSAVSWGIPSTLNANPLFIAKNDAGARQAITAPLTAALNDKKQPMVFFGTGSFYRTGDNEVPVNPAVESFYGIIDNGLLIDGRDDLLEQQIIKEAKLSSGDKFRAITQNELEDGDKGWYLDLAWQAGEGATGALGERVVAKASLRNDRVIFTTMTPSADPCDSGGTSWIMAVALGSGGRLSYVYFDTNGDGILDSKDLTTLTDDGDGIPWSGYSDEDAGVLKGTAQIEADDATLLCFAGSNGATPRCIETPDTRRQGRQSWHEVRVN